MDEKKLKEKLTVAVKFRDAGSPEQAVRVLREITDHAPSFLKAYFIIGGVFMDLKRYDESADIFEKLVHKKPEDEHASLGLFHSLFSLLRIKEAFTEMERFLEISGTDDSEYKNILISDALKRGYVVTANVDKEKLIGLCRNMAENLVAYIPTSDSPWDEMIGNILKPENIIQADSPDAVCSPDKTENR